jgi:hypothetical protein
MQNLLWSGLHLGKEDLEAYPGTICVFSSFLRETVSFVLFQVEHYYHPSAGKPEGGRKPGRLLVFQVNHSANQRNIYGITKETVHPGLLFDSAAFACLF